MQETETPGFVARLSPIEHRWLDWCRRTAPVFEGTPEIVPARYTIFKRFVERRVAPGPLERMREAGRLTLRRRATRVPLDPVDVLLWVAADREIYRAPLLAVAEHLVAAGARVAFGGPPRAVARLADRPDVIAFRGPHLRRGGRSWSRAWAELREADPALDPGSRPDFVRLGRAVDSGTAEARRLLGRLRPSAVCTASDHMLPSSAVCFEADRAGIPSVVLQHGAVNAYNVPLTAGAMAAWGDLSRGALAELDAPGERLVVLGSPRHDELPRRGDPAAALDLASALGLAERPCLVFFSNGNDPSRNGSAVLRRCVEWLEETAEALQNRAHVVVRLHPNEDGGLYAGARGLVVTRSEADLGTTLAGAAAVASLCSTALLEAALYGTPTLQLLAYGWPELVDFWRHGLAIRVASAGELAEAARAALLGGRRDAPEPETLGEAFANRGRAAEAVAGHLLSLTGAREGERKMTHGR